VNRKENREYRLVTDPLQKKTSSSDNFRLLLLLTMTGLARRLLGKSKLKTKIN
jgi:hypothetical protein